MKNRFPNVVTELKESPDYRIKGPSPWTGLIIHHTGNENLRSAVSWLSTKDAHYLSAHFVIGRDGECVQMVDPDCHVAFHAGKSQYYHPLEHKLVSGWNDYAIGIELIGDGNRFEYTDEQMITLARLSAACMDRYKSIDPRCITGHQNVSPGRKVDPGRLFDWRRYFRLLHKCLEEFEQAG